MTIEIEAGASQRQCSMKSQRLHAFSAAGLVGRLSTADAALSPWLSVQKEPIRFASGGNIQKPLAHEQGSSMRTGAQGLVCG